MSVEDFNKVQARGYDGQAIFFLNAFWAEMGSDAELVWTWTNKFKELDKAGASDGNSLDEFWSHKFLETLGETMTVIKMREVLRQVDVNNDKRMSVLEYLLFRYQQTIKELLSRPQDTNDELIKAQEALRAVQAEIGKIEKKKEELEAKIGDGSGVKANAAKNELEQLLVKDNTDLNRSLVTAEAAVRKAQKIPSVSAQGGIWWVNRELEEAKKYKPKPRAPK
eukprot:TRINITY_DN4757_c0_g1_i1.p1 TRINITY_DN4757_c0_g1~~TRINITY_DN4757_c0_g1_i1.p1  ORF type:complete len:223 (-),score=63.11 TRINITY_DN4757_c0_g1_i1:171-839(-)